MAGSRESFDAGLMLYSIAKLDSWSKEGISYSTLWGEGKTPSGVKAIRQAASADISKIYNIVTKHDDVRVSRSDKTTAFYQLIKDVYCYRETNANARDPQAMIETFCGRYLSDVDRSTLPGAAKVNANPWMSALKLLS